jgi:hypothetical protein
MHDLNCDFAALSAKFDGVPYNVEQIILVDFKVVADQLSTTGFVDNFNLQLVRLQVDLEGLQELEQIFLKTFVS